MLVINGWNSAIAEAMRRWVAAVKPNETVEAASEAHEPTASEAERFLFCQGLLPGRSLSDYREEDAAAVFKINFTDIAFRIDWLIRKNHRARICVITSESAFSGSYDEGYAAAKAAMNHYIENKRLHAPDQQLVGIAPVIIRDAGMTTRREDLITVDKRGARHNKKRWLTAAEVARMAYFLLYEDLGYTTGTVIRMHGGDPRA